MSYVPDKMWTDERTEIWMDKAATVIMLSLHMDRCATVNHDHLYQNMVNFNPKDKDYIVR